MKLTDLFEFGKVVPGVNMPYYMTQNEIQKQAKKLGMETDANGKPKINLMYKNDVKWKSAPVYTDNDINSYGPDGTLRKPKTSQ